MSRMLKPTILSLSLLTVMSGAAVAPALARIAAAFPDASQTSIKLILTMPAVFIILFSLLSGRLSARFSKRRLLTCGLVIYLLGGVSGGLVNRFELLLAARAVLGMGVGLIMPLSTGLIADFFVGDQRARMMGYATASSNLGGIFATLFSGMLAVYNWRYAFGVYGASIVVLLLVLFFLPESGGKAVHQGHEHSRLPRAVYAWAAGAFLLMLGFYAIPVNLAIFLERNGLGDASAAGMTIAIVTASGFVAGLSFGSVQALLRKLLPPLLFALSGAGYLLLSQAHSLPAVCLAASVVGLGLGWTMPLLFTGATRAGGSGMGVQTMAVVTSMIFLGQFMSPLVLDFIGSLWGDISPRFIFLLIAGCFAVTLSGDLGRLAIMRTGVGKNGS
jgi:predicted MFS family arabinose efflux permease